MPSEALKEFDLLRLSERNVRDGDYNVKEQSKEENTSYKKQAKKGIIRSNW